MKARVINPSRYGHMFSDQAVKFGFLSSPDMLGQFWFVDTGQEVIGHRLPSSQQVYIVLEGSGYIRSYKNDAFDNEAFYVPSPIIKVDPPPRTEPRRGKFQDAAIKPKSVITVPAGVLHTIYNDGPDQMILLSISSPKIHNAVYISR